jgi:Raf kinase inhibitor-like YbhB/YbcL family protein
MRVMSLGIVLLAASAVTAAAAGEKGRRTMGELRITSPAFASGEAIPARYTCDGADVSPPLAIAGVPEQARSLALVMDDPDAPVGTWVHWVEWNIDPKTREIPENGSPPGGVEGRNSWHRTGYGGPCPPSGSHRYFFKLYALDALLDLPSGAGKTELERAMRGHVVAEGELMGTYRRSSK